jgi:hypothetical protein
MRLRADDRLIRNLKQGKSAWLLKRQLEANLKRDILLAQ